MKLAHTDLKPENILLVDSSHETDGGRGGRQGRRPYRQLRRTAIKLIDFGSATYEGQHHTSIVCTRHYRPPEVVLGISWDYPCDMWSVGCILIGTRCCCCCRCWGLNAYAAADDACCHCCQSCG